MISLTKLRALAKGASPGPWFEDDGNLFSEKAARERMQRIVDRLEGRAPRVDHDDDDGFVAKCDQRLPNFEADAAYIAAANPAVMLELLDRLEALEGAAEVIIAIQFSAVCQNPPFISTTDVVGFGNAIQATLAALDKVRE